jgi:hypothetical protein
MHVGQDIASGVLMSRPLEHPALVRPSNTLLNPCEYEYPAGHCAPKMSVQLQESYKSSRNHVS